MPARSRLLYRILSTPPERWRRLAAFALTMAAVAAFPTRPAAAGPAWVAADGTPSPAATRALALLADAPSEGLRAEDYAAAQLAAQSGALVHQDAGAATAFARALDSAVDRYLSDLNRGRIEPRALGFRLAPRAAPVAAPADFEAAPRLRPSLAQYTLLREQLARYRALAADPALAPPVLKTTLRPGDSDPALPALARWLAALGDLPAQADAPGSRYDGALVDAVQHFQRRHGLAADGVLGRATRAALATPLQHRVRQIELAMERLRWLAPLQGRFIAINIPSFQLWAVDGASAGPPVAMGVIVGRALNTRTPVLQGEIRHLIFRPYWNVPRSILLKELLPALRADPARLQKDALEIVRGSTDEAPVQAFSEAALDELQRGTLRLRQRPGPKNSLGLVKFVFPNDDDIYLHGTPAQGLFQRDRRDFSHGCVRVEDPLALAEWVLGEQGGWPRERIQAAMAADRPATVRLDRPLPVLLFYTTAVVLPQTGELHFADDIYGHDARLAQALERRSAQLRLGR